MPRKKIEEPVINLKSWDDVNIALADIGERERTIETLLVELQARIDEMKLQADSEVKPHRAAIAELELQIKGFADMHRDEMQGRKTKVLPFGSTGYRKSTKIKLPGGAAKIAAIIERLRSKHMTDCIVAPALKVDKEALKKYPAQDIIDVGASLEVDDTWWYEVDRETLESR